MDVAENYKCPKLTRFFMRLLGMWPTESPKEQIISYFILIFSISMMLLSSVAMTFDFWFQRKDFVEISYVIPCVSVTYTELTKLLVFFHHRKEVFDFIIFTESYFWRKSFKPEHQRLLKNCDDISYPACAALIFIAEAVAWHYISIPIFESWGKDATERTLVFRWYFDIVPYTESPYYEWVMMIQGISTFYVSFIFVANAIFLFNISMYCGSYFEILRSRFESLCEFNHHEIINQKCDVSVHYEMLKECIKEHKLLIQYVKRIDYLYRYIMFAQVFSSVTQICFAGFQILLGASKSVQRTILSAEYIFASFIELYFFTVSSDQIRFTSSELHEAVYRSQWYLLPCNNKGKEYRMSINFVIVRAFYPCVVHIGNFGIMSYDTFTWVLRTSMSYFTVLHQFLEQNENLI